MPIRCTKTAPKAWTSASTSVTQFCSVVTQFKFDQTDDSRSSTIPKFAGHQLYALSAWKCLGLLQMMSQLYCCHEAKGTLVAPELCEAPRPCTVYLQLLRAQELTKSHADCPACICQLSSLIFFTAGPRPWKRRSISQNIGEGHLDGQEAETQEPLISM